MKESTSGQISKVKPRVGFLGLGWIGRHRMEAIIRSRLVEPVVAIDPVQECAETLLPYAPEAAIYKSFDELVEIDLDGLIIATPSAFHADQAMAALERGIPVFCQKPLGKNAQETRAVIETAKRMDRLLMVDLSYRFVKGMQNIRDRIQAGKIGDIFAVNLVFHNAYGPDRDWFYDPKLSGGGCVIDLGVHLVDLAYWVLGKAEVQSVTSQIYTQGKLLQALSNQVEDFAVARIDLASGTCITLSCSWRLHAGCDAIIEATFYGTHGGFSLKNVNGSFFDFITESYCGTQREMLTQPPDDWGSRSAIYFAERLVQDNSYDVEIETLIPVSETLDAVYKHPVA